MFKSLLLISILLMEVMVVPAQANASMINPSKSFWKAIAYGMEYSRETETCINLRGCGRRERT